MNDNCFANIQSDLELVFLHDEIFNDKTLRCELQYLRLTDPRRCDQLFEFENCFLINTTHGTAIQYQHIQSQHLLSNHSQTIRLILINQMSFSRYLFSLIKVCKEVVRIYNRIRVNSSKRWQNVETKCVGTKCVGTKQLRPLYTSHSPDMPTLRCKWGCSISSG